MIVLFYIWSCSGDVPFTTANDFEKYLHDVLEEIRNKIPRVFVNIVELFNISMVCLTLIMYIISITEFTGVWKIERDNPLHWYTQNTSNWVYLCICLWQGRWQDQVTCYDTLKSPHIDIGVTPQWSYTNV